jgi:hypothetical protein
MISLEQKASSAGYGFYGLSCVGRCGIALLTLVALSGHPVLAAPMKCGTEEQACITACTKGARATLSTCVTGCGASQAYCKKTGCWVNGAKNYCGLFKQ